jgi:hypothetical protein
LAKAKTYNKSKKVKTGDRGKKGAVEEEEEELDSVSFSPSVFRRRQES